MAEYIIYGDTMGRVYPIWCHNGQSISYMVPQWAEYILYGATMAEYILYSATMGRAYPILLSIYIYTCLYSILCRHVHNAI